MSVRQLAGDEYARCGQVIAQCNAQIFQTIDDGVILYRLPFEGNSNRWGCGIESYHAIGFVCLVTETILNIHFNVVLPFTAGKVILNRVVTRVSGLFDSTGVMRCLEFLSVR